MIDNVPNTLIGCRDKALLLVGFAGAFRRSELTNIQLKDLSFTEDGLIITIPKSKTDQEGKGRAVAIVRGTHCCPINTLSDWIERAHIDSGFIFRRILKSNKLTKHALSAQSVALIIKCYMALLGNDSSKYSAHSLRRGFLTSAAQNHADIFKMMAVSGHRSLDTLKEYIDDAERFIGHAGSGLL